MKRTIMIALLALTLAATASAAPEAPTQPAATSVSAVAAPLAPATVSIAPDAVPAPPATTSVAPSPSSVKGPSLLPAGALMIPPGPMVGPIKLGYVEFQRIAQESKTALKAKNSITASGEKLKKQLTAKGKKLEALKKSLEAQAKQMNPLEQEAKGKEFQAKVKEYQESLQNAEKEMAKQEESVSRKLIEQVSKVVKEYGEQNGYTLIVSTKDLLYFDGNHPLSDVTAEVIKKLDK